MGIKNEYKTLFNFTILHHYFLDEGTQDYTMNVPGAPNNATRIRIEKALANNRALYTLREYMTITPSESTARKLKNYRASFYFGKESFKVGMKQNNADPTIPFIAFPTGDLYFDFIVRIQDAFFENYTQIKIDRSKIIFISNQTELNSNADEATAVDFKRISNFNGNYVTPPTAIDLTNDMQANEFSGAFMIIRIHLEGEGSDLDLVRAPAVLNGPIRFALNTPEFEIVYPTRLTKWRYIDSKTNTLLYTTPTALPLTRNGYIQVINAGKEFPNPDAKLFVTVEQPANVFTYYSETFI